MQEIAGLNRACPGPTETMVGAAKKIMVGAAQLEVFAAVNGAGQGPIETMVGAAKLQVSRAGGQGVVDV